MKEEWDVFISYSSQDEVFANQIALDLKSSGLTVWKDTSEIVPGERLRESIETGIRNSKVFIIIVSARSLNSRWVLNELDAAMLSEVTKRMNFVLPILIGRIDPDRLPTDIVGKRFIDLRYNFRRKYLLNRMIIAKTVRILADQKSSGKTGKNKLHLVPDFLNRILAHRYDGHREKSDAVKTKIPEMAEYLFNEVIDKIQVEQVFGDEMGIKECRDLFLARYGNHGARQLVLFVIDEVGLSFSGGFNGDEFDKLLNSIWIILFFFGLREQLGKEQGLDLAVKTMNGSGLGVEVVLADDPLGKEKEASS